METELLQKIVELNRQKESIQNETERQTREIKKHRRETIEAALPRREGGLAVSRGGTVSG